MDYRRDEIREYFYHYLKENKEYLREEKGLSNWTNEIKKQNNKFPLMEYFLSGKPLEECSVECQKQLNELNLKA